MNFLTKWIAVILTSIFTRQRMALRAVHLAIMALSTCCEFSHAELDSGYHSKYVGVYAKLPAPISLDPNVPSNADESQWIQDGDSSLLDGTVIEGVCRGVNILNQDINSRARYLTGAANAGHWFGSRIVDAPGYRDADVLQPGADPNNTATWKITPGIVDSAVDLGTMYVGYFDSHLYFAMERRQVGEPFNYEIEINRLQPKKPYQPSRSFGDVLVQISSGTQVSPNPHLTVWRWNGIRFVKSPTNGLAILNYNSQAIDAPPWGVNGVDDDWSSANLQPGQFLGGGLLLNGTRNLPDISAGVYVQFRSMRLMIQPGLTSLRSNASDITPIYGIALPHPTSIPFIESLGATDRFSGSQNHFGTLRLDCSNSFEEDGTPARDATWTISIPSNGNQIAFFVDGVWVSGESPIVVHSTNPNGSVNVKYDTDADYISASVSLQVNSSDGESDTNGPHSVKLWGPLEAFPVLSLTGGMLSYAVRWNGAPQPYQTFWQLGDNNFITVLSFSGNQGVLALPPDFPHGQYYVGLNVGGTELSASPFVADANLFTVQTLPGYKTIIINI